MSELESIRSIARRLIAEHREKIAAREQKDDLCARELVDALREAGPVPPALRFDIALTEGDCAFLRSLHIARE
jgi:hypothetical protein